MLFRKKKLPEVRPTVQLNEAAELPIGDEDRVTTVTMNISTNTSNPMCTVRVECVDDHIHVGSASDIGSRSYQQDTAKVADDYVYAVSQKMIAIMCDGMGGLQGGEKASALCAELLYQAFLQVDVSDNVPQFMRTMVSMLDKEVCALTDENGAPLKAGTTLACAVLIGKELYWVSVGDSRIYLLRDGNMICLTQDHNFKMILDERVKKGLITQEAADTHPKREALVSFIGIGGPQYIDCNEKPLLLSGGDCILICSDGLYRTMREDEILSIVTSAGDDMQSAASMLTDAAIAKRNRNQDNTSAIVMKYINNETA